MSDIPNRDDQVFAVFTGAMHLSVEQRRPYLDKACVGDLEMRRQVEALLRSSESAGNFLETSNHKLRSAVLVEIGPKPGDSIGRYKLLQQIGEGGCGVVFMAEQNDPIRRRVALKVIKPGMDSKSVIARFESERQALALMDHPNIARIFDAGATESGRPYFVMELVRGVKITEYCDQNSLTTEERLNLFIQVCQAVQHAHQKGIIHRDIKPSNILVTLTQEGIALPVVIDFGIAKATNNQRLTDKTLFTAFEMLIGTPAYMSPEQAAFTTIDVDTRSDIYSLGVLLYELLTGSTPFDGGALSKAGLDEIRRVIREEDPPCPSTRLSKLAKVDLTTVAQRRKSGPPGLIRSISGDLDWIAMKALEKDRTRRYATANGLATDVQRFLADEVISARPPGAVYKFKKTVARHKLLFATMGVIALLLVASLIVVSASLARERRSRQEAEISKGIAEAQSGKSRQVTKFLETMLQGVGPSAALGQDTSMLRGILDRTANAVGKEMMNQPAMEAELRNLIGRVYFEIGAYGQAEEMHQAALAIDQKLFGPKSREAADSLNDLGLAFWRAGKQREAESAHREALDIRRRLFGEENADVATSLNNLADVYRHYGRPTEAEPLTRESLAIRQKLFGPESLEAADSLRVLSILLGDENKPVEAEAMARDVLDIRRKLLGREDPLVSASLADVAWADGLQGKWDEVESLQWEALTMQKKLLGDKHPAVLASLRNLCATLEREGKFAEAEVLQREALAVENPPSVKESPRALAELAGLVHVLIVQEKFEEAEQRLDEVLTPAFRQRPASASLLALRADIMGREGRWQEAAADATLLVAYQPANLDHFHLLAPLLAITHNQPAYEQLCRKILLTFTNTANPYIADRMAKDCLLMPQSGLDLQWMNKLADTAISADKDEISMPFFQTCKAMSEYRLGHLPEAIDWGNKVLDGSQPYARSQTYGILAMAQWRLGKKDTARAMLMAGETLTQSLLPSAGSQKIGGDWGTWLFSRVSLDEAEALVQTEPALEKARPPK